MKKRSLSIISIILILLVTLSVTSCNQKEQPTEKPSETEQPTNAPAENQDVYRQPNIWNPKDYHIMHISIGEIIGQYTPLADQGIFTVARAKILSDLSERLSTGTELTISFYSYMEKEDFLKHIEHNDTFIVSVFFGGGYASDTYIDSSNQKVHFDNLTIARDDAIIPLKNDKVNIIEYREAVIEADPITDTSLFALEYFPQGMPLDELLETIGGFKSNSDTMAPDPSYDA